LGRIGQQSPVLWRDIGAAPLPQLQTSVSTTGRGPIKHLRLDLRGVNLATCPLHWMTPPAAFTGSKGARIIRRKIRIA